MVVSTISMLAGKVEVFGQTMAPILIGIQKAERVPPAKWSNFKLDLTPFHNNANKIQILLEDIL